MKSGIHRDWYFALKMKVVWLVLTFSNIKEDLIGLLFMHTWVLQDINLCETFTHVQECMDQSNQNLEEWIERMKVLEEGTISFNPQDLLDEFEYICENIDLEASFMENIINYILIMKGPSINELETIEQLEEYQAMNIQYYNQIKINNQQLKQLRKERKDDFE